MLNVDRVWARQAPRFPGQKLSGFRLQVITASYSISASGSSQNQAVSFGAGSVILGVIAAAQVTSQAATQQYRPGMDLFSVAISYQASNAQVVGSVEGIGSCVFGPYGDQFPGLEIVLPQNSALVYNFTNLTSSAIQITLGHHCLMKGAIG
jgi:hypothetical protein